MADFISRRSPFVYIFAGTSIPNALKSVTMSPSEAQHDLAALNDTSCDFLQPERCRQSEVRNAVVNDPFDRHRLLLALIAIWICEYIYISYLASNVARK